MYKLIISLMIFVIPVVLTAQDSPDEPYMDAYVVIAAKSTNYYKLREKMFELAGKMHIDIDTFGRGYDNTKKLICLPEDSEDEIYAGQYFPRRYPSETFSLEYLDYYTNENPEGERPIILVAAISGSKEEAEAILAKIKKYEKKSNIINAKIYMGCMH